MYIYLKNQLYCSAMLWDQTNKENQRQKCCKID